MTLTDDDIKAFQGLWKQEMGEELTSEKAREYGENILALVALVARWKSRSVSRKS